ncbi:hypothetical protein CONPUDRAFT_53735 [Coniophora puteana RWD-64-598 SS2]|uniref:C2H2-type domain-containing protein n=1 Tax=Coniophora puteana (strain RWD-64-598) TaxID=741705 RepID=A0A5M3MTP0_CONPW|nr:uncharacterized protein CONPUDRAFT_53735 [Coniophora puteana RWD-64-598 SS2]EIW82450.1 hypothetical protein CONPUDRAFT_53735 [Coniophora puteana RWD-64-598 SS2]
MSSWSTSSYPPPRRSRSRSPRASHPSRGPPDQSFTVDPYRQPWDMQERERTWSEYDRERASYEYNRRGRSRSPVDETGRKRRRRSLSPYDRERYDPHPRYGDDYDAHSRGHGHRSPPRGQFPPSYAPARRPPPDPRTLDHLATLKQYAEWFRYFHPQQAADEDAADKAAEQEVGNGTKPRNGIKARWEKYKKDFLGNQLQIMFDHHRKFPWFAEKYEPSPDLVALRRRVRRQGWKGRMQAFLQDMESGKFDPDYSESVAEPTSPSKELGSNGEAAQDSNAVGQPEDPKTTGDDDVTFNLDAEEDVGDNDPSRIDSSGRGNTDKRSNRGEEISVPPEGNQVMIRTIPPDIGRVKLEEACSKVPGYVYLALGDPLQKRNYYRAGWIKFRDDADMTLVMNELSDTKIEGFKLHVVHNTKPFMNRVRYVPEGTSKPDRIKKDLENAKLLASVLEEEAAALRKPSSSANGEANGVPNNHEDSTMHSGHDSSGGEEELEPVENGSVAVERRIEKIMSEMQERGLLENLDESAIDAKKEIISLDMYIAYLRAAFHTCYYCAVVTDHVEELQRKCLKHMRKPLSKLHDEQKAVDPEKAEQEKREGDEDKEKLGFSSKADSRDWKKGGKLVPPDERWFENFDAKIALLINRNGVDPREYGGKSTDEELSRAVEPYVKQEDEGRYRCKTCSKLFKATSFVEKHIANKHAELVKGLEDLSYFNNFALDPHRVQPFAHPPNNATLLQGVPPQAFGLQGPPAFVPQDFGRTPYYGAHPGFPPAVQYPSGAYWDQFGYQYPAGFVPPIPQPRRDDAITARRLSDRISGFVAGYEPSSEITIPVGAGLPAKPQVSMDFALGNGPVDNGKKGGRRGGTGSGPPPPPPNAKEDPRATAGRKVSYHDMDLVAEGDVELTY